MYVGGRDGPVEGPHEPGGGGPPQQAGKGGEGVQGQVGAGDQGTQAEAGGGEEEHLQQAGEGHGRAQVTLPVIRIRNSVTYYRMVSVQEQAPEGGERADDEADEGDVRDEAAAGEGARGDHGQTQVQIGFNLMETMARHRYK